MHWKIEFLVQILNYCLKKLTVMLLFNVISNIWCLINSLITFHSKCQWKWLFFNVLWTIFFDWIQCTIWFEFILKTDEKVRECSIKKCSEWNYIILRITKWRKRHDKFSHNSYNSPDIRKYLWLKYILHHCTWLQNIVLFFSRSSYNLSQFCIFLFIFEIVHYFEMIFFYNHE